MICRSLCFILLVAVGGTCSPAQESPAQENSAQENSAQENSAQENSAQENPTQETTTQKRPFQPKVLQAAAAKPADQDKALQATIDQYVAAYNSGDVDQVMSFWDEQADFVDIRGRFHEGRDLIAALFRRGFAENQGRTIRLEPAARKFLTPQVAVDDGILELTMADGSTDRGRYTVVWTKRDGKWRIRSARDIPIELEEAAAEMPQEPLDALAWLLGKWRAESEGMKVTFDCEWTLDKKFLVQKFDIESNDETMRVLTYITFDPAEACYRSWFFDNRGGFGSGTWTCDEDQFRIATLLVMPDGRPGSLLMTWQQDDENTARWQGMEREVAGEPLPDIELTYSRVQ